MSVNKVDILAIGAHPDDVECSVAGVIIKHIAMGRTVAIADLTAGESGSFGNAESRKKEADAAAEILGVKCRVQSGLPDGGIENNEASRSIVMQTIRRFRPEIVLCNAIKDFHPDHAEAAKLVSDACFLSGLKKKETFYEGVIQEAWRPKTVYHYVQDLVIEPDFVIDITSQMDKKIEAIKAFESQFVKPGGKESNAVMSIIDHIKSTNSIYGRHIKVSYAEGFTVDRYIGVNDFFDLI